jgi:hypothetical protein
MRIHRLTLSADEVAFVADEIGFLVGQLLGPGCDDVTGCR